MPQASAPGGPPPLIAVSIGDPAGIGPDIAIAAWLVRKARQLPAFALFGDPDVLKQRAADLVQEVPIASITNVQDAITAFTDTLPVLPVGRVVGNSSSSRDDLVVSAIEQATAAVARGDALALLTNPIAKTSLQRIGLPYPGHTAFLGVLAERLWGGGPVRPVMMLAAAELKVVPATVHIPLSAVPSALTQALLVDTIRKTAAALTEDFGITAPRIAVAGLNPHAGESGLIGSEEASTIVPAIAELARSGVIVTGPHSADSLFHAEARHTYDAVVAMYHDQALIPFKTLAFDRGVNVTLALPFVRTSPDHGTAYSLAGTGKARPESFISALLLAAELGQRRAVRRRRPS